ncbi:MAG: MnmC family methyltransferase [Bdellovibrionota bacterium]
MGSLREEDLLESRKEREGLYFHLLKTLDGSYSASSSSSEKMDQESMHSSQGAFTETEYIYGEAIQFCLEQIQPAHFVNLGLGIGYNEMSIFCRAITRLPDLKESLSKTDFQILDRFKIKITSFELHSELNQHFLDYLKDDCKNPMLKKAYDHIFSLYLEKFELTAIQVKTYALALYDAGLWRLQEEVLANYQSLEKVNCYLFDAYSKSASSELWSPHFLESFLEKADDKSILSTYAATGDLNRALRSRGFWIHSRAGFAFKRQSTWAIKGLPKELPPDTL